MTQSGSAPIAIEPVAVPMANAPATFGLSRSGIYRGAKAGKIKLLKVGCTTLVDAASVRAYLASLPTVLFGINPAEAVSKKVA